MNKKGFTLVEILVAVMIVVILVTMAAPMYDKAIEKSRLAEARATSKKLFDAKMRLMDSMDIETFNGQFGFENLDFSLNCQEARSDRMQKCSTKDFVFSLKPTGAVNGICAARRGDGDGATTNFLYLGELAAAGTDAFRCNSGTKGSCDLFGMDSTGSAWCTPN